MFRILENISLAPYNTFGIDAKCDKLIEFETIEDLREVFSAYNIAEGRWNVISGGSNIVFTSDYKGVLLHPVSKKIDITEDDSGYTHIGVDAGVLWNDLVAWAVGNGLWGLENLSYIPGLVGAAPVQNIGAYGREVKDVITGVEMFSVDTAKTVCLDASHCAFGYRDSIFKNLLKGKVVITKVYFRLSKTADPNIGYGDLKDLVESYGGATLENISRAVVDIRRSKLPEPSELGNAGSFFKNPVVDTRSANILKDKYPDMPLYPSEKEGCSKLAAGWLIDQSGMKGYRQGAVGVHEKQALVLVNYGGATGTDVLALARKVIETVKAKFGIELQMEVNIF